MRFIRSLVMLCGVLTAESQTLYANQNSTNESDVCYIDEAPSELSAGHDIIKQDASSKSSEYATQLISLSGNSEQSILQKCASLLRHGIVCMVINDTNTNSLSQASVGSDNVMQAHMKRRVAARQDFESDDVPDLGGRGFSFDGVALGANSFSQNDGLSLPVSSYEQMNAVPQGADDTVAQAAMRAAYDMVRNRYNSVIYDGKNNPDQPNITAQDAISLTRGALSAAAERAFEKFMSDSLGVRDFEGQTYDGLQGYFVTAFKHAASSSVKSVGRRFVNDIRATGDFKSLQIRSELLSGLDKDIARAFIDTGLAAAKNSQYAFLRNLEVSYKIRENSKPEYSLLTVQPIYSSEGKTHNIFGQAAVSYDGDRSNITSGLGYRYMPNSEEYVVGSNLFIDYQRPYNHMRVSAGLDLQTSLWGASTNYYKGISDWKDSRTGFQEQSLDGFDFELAGRMPFLPALEVFGRGYRWQGVNGSEDIDGTEFRVEYSPVPAFTLEGLMNDEQGRETELALGLRYNYRFGAPAEYLYDWNEQFRRKSASEYIFSRVRRENEIRVQERADPDADVKNAPPAIGLLAFTPVAAATGISVGSDVDFTFEQDVQANSGNIVFTDLTDGSNTFTIPVTDPRVSIVGSMVSVDLSAQLLEFSSNYEMTFAAGVFEDLSGNNTAALNGGVYEFTTIVDPTAGFPAATSTLAAGVVVAFTPRNTAASWQTTINVTGALDGIILESGGTGRGISASFGGGDLVFAAGQGNVSATGGGAVFGSFPIASIPNGLHHFVFVAKPNSPAEIGVYMDGIRIIDESTAAAMSSNEWAGTDSGGYGVGSGTIRDGVNNNALSGATLTNNLSFYSGSAPADF